MRRRTVIRRSQHDITAALALVALARATQPGALDLYPPTSRGRFENVPVDHFTFTQPVATFSLRYLAHDALARGAAAPVLMYCGNEGAIEAFYNATGAMFEFARALGARVVFVEHRYYGGSLPFGARGSFSPSGLRYLTIEQALADFALVARALPSLIGCRGARGRNGCDVVLFGGSYGGMLAAWHRLKYPHLSVGAIASGAPVDFYPQEHAQRVFRAAYERTFAEHGGDARCGDARAPRALRALRRADADALAAAGVRPAAARRPRRSTRTSRARSRRSRWSTTVRDGFRRAAPGQPGAGRLREPRRRARRRRARRAAAARRAQRGRADVRQRDGRPRVLRL